MENQTNPQTAKIGDSDVSTKETTKMATTEVIITPPPITKSASTPAQDLPKISDKIESDPTESTSQNKASQSASQESLTVAAGESEIETLPANSKGKKKCSRLHMTFRRILNAVVSFCTCCKGCSGSYETVPSEVRKQSFSEVQESVNKDDASANAKPEIN